MKSKKILSLILTLVMIVGMLPVNAIAADTITVYTTVSNKGVLAADKNGMPMGYRQVQVSDLDSDNKITVSDAMLATHDANSVNGINESTGKDKHLADPVLEGKPLLSRV